MPPTLKKTDSGGNVAVASGEEAAISRQGKGCLLNDGDWGDLKWRKDGCEARVHRLFGHGDRRERRKRALGFALLRCLDVAGLRARAFLDLSRLSCAKFWRIRVRRGRFVCGAWAPGSQNPTMVSEF